MAWIATQEKFGAQFRAQKMRRAMDAIVAAHRGTIHLLFRHGCDRLRGPGPREPHDLQGDPLALDMGLLLSPWEPGWRLSLNWKSLTPRKFAT